MLPLKGTVAHLSHDDRMLYNASWLSPQLYLLFRSCGNCRIMKQSCMNTGKRRDVLEDVLSSSSHKLITAQMNKRLGLSLYNQASSAVSCEGPSCIFVGPLESAQKDRLEALYKQARDSYYSGRPLVIDEMYDKVETQLRWRGSKLVMKYPRCSLKRLSAYGDVEADHSQLRALEFVWYTLLGTGLLFAAGPPVCALNNVCRGTFHTHFSKHGITAASELSIHFKELLIIAMCFSFGATMGVAAVRSLQGLWRGDLVAVKGCCPNCCEEVYAFVKVEVEASQYRHRTDCHVCEQRLLFEIKIEKPSCDISGLRVYGRVYLLASTKDLAPRLEVHKSR